MMDGSHPPNTPIALSAGALQTMLEDAAERGAKRALTSVGLGDDKAQDHVRGLRDLFVMYRAIRNGLLNQIGKAIALTVIAVVIAGVGAKFNVWGGKP